MRSAPESAAIMGLRFVQRQLRSTGPAGRARIVWPLSHRSRSSASAAAVR